MKPHFSSLVSGAALESPLKGVAIRSVHLERTMMTRMEFEAGCEIPEHAHEHEQITLILDGEMEITVAGETRLLSQGEAVAVPSNVLHSARFPTATVAVDAWSPVRDDYKT